MLLEEIVTNKHYAFFDYAEDWQDAICKSCMPFVETHCATFAYAQSVIKCVEEFGPYIVIVPGLAIPHSAKGDSCVMRTAISFVKFQRPVSFEPGNPEKDARIFFALAAVDEDEHLKNMRQLFKILSNDELLKKLEDAQSPDDLLRLDKEYLFGI